MTETNKPASAAAGNTQPPTSPDKTKTVLAPRPFGCPRDFLQNRFVYITVSPRARGLSIGVNMNPDKHCNFDCVYCEVDRCKAFKVECLDVHVMAEELQHTLEFVNSGDIRQYNRYSALPDELLTLRHVALSGDGEPTICPNFTEAVQSVVHVRASGRAPFFKIVLITNGTGLDLEQVKQSLKLLIKTDEIWVKLDAGTQTYMERVNRPQVPLKKVLANILALGQQRPIVIQSLFPLLDGHEPSTEEIDQYTLRLKELQTGGAMISQVQIYSATRPIAGSGCGHLPLKTLSRIAKTIRAATGLKAEVF
ncbi:MAG TPA: radical SAM protein [Verrucomicrobiae bacterium]|nr:radical SAM protein [Verrucomicrobiae bacterium]